MSEKELSEFSEFKENMDIVEDGLDITIDEQILTDIEILSNSEYDDVFCVNNVGVEAIF